MITRTLLYPVDVVHLSVRRIKSEHQEIVKDCGALTGAPFFVDWRGYVSLSLLNRTRMKYSPNRREYDLNKVKYDPITKYNPNPQTPKHNPLRANKGAHKIRPKPTKHASTC